ncbi:MAG: hypothetical protein H3Z52_07280 [archaeon]|nr:hypothetical protein [archaeon]
MKSKRIDKARALMSDAMRINDEAIVMFSKGIDPMNIVDMVWEAYSKVEHAIILLKLDLGDEFGQRQESLDEDPLDIGGLLVKASDSLVNSLNKISSDLHEALMDARLARNSLKLALSNLEKGI